MAGARGRRPALQAWAAAQPPGTALTSGILGFSGRVGALRPSPVRSGLKLMAEAGLSSYEEGHSRQAGWVL